MIKNGRHTQLTKNLIIFCHSLIPIDIQLFCSFGEAVSGVVGNIKLDFPHSRGGTAKCEPGSEFCMTVSFFILQSFLTLATSRLKKQN